MLQLLCMAITVSFLASGPVFAHTIQNPAGDVGAEIWPFDPWTGVPMLVAATLYGSGLVRLWSSSAIGRGISVSRVVLYLVGFAVLAVALFSPLDSHAANLFSAHMIQHQLLMIVAAPLLVLGTPGAVFLWSLPRRWRRAFGRMTGRRGLQIIWQGLTLPIPAWCLFLLALWLWHVPAYYQAAVEDPVVHTFQHISFLGSALIYWISVFDRPKRASGYGLAFLSTFTTAVHCSALGALLTFADWVWYPVYSDDTAAYGLSPLEDQQLGGLIMWVPSGIVFVATGLGSIAAWLRAAEAKVNANEKKRWSSSAPGSIRMELGE